MRIAVAAQQLGARSQGSEAGPARELALELGARQVLDGRRTAVSNAGRLFTLGSRGALVVEAWEGVVVVVLRLSLDSVEVAHAGSTALSFFGPAAGLSVHRSNGLPAVIASRISAVTAWPAAR